MPVIINELEIVTDPPPQNEQLSSESELRQAAQRQAARQVSPETIAALWRHEQQRRSRMDIVAADYD